MLVLVLLCPADLVAPPSLHGRPLVMVLRLFLGILVVESHNDYRKSERYFWSLTLGAFFVMT
jgi:hypothetical protein